MDKYILKKNKFLSCDECSYLINYFLNSNAQDKDSIRNYTSVVGEINWNEFIFLKRKLVYCFEDYRKKHSFLKSLSWHINEQFNIQRYDIGKSYNGEHMEHGINEYDRTRILGWMVYLNTIKNKGGTCWPQQNFTSKPREGDLYVWPAAWTHSHYGISAPRELKYIITGWCKLTNLT